MNEPRFQYSIFPNDSRGEQYVVRADNMAEFKVLLEELKAHIAGRIEQGAKPVTPAPKPEDDLIVPCKECGGTTTYREGVSKATGKPWKAHFCDKPNSTCKPYFVK
jgi:hypothetical protein